MLIATAVSTAAKGAGDYFSGQGSARQAKRKAKETRRETEAGMLQDALQRSAELQAHGLASRKKLGQRSAQSMQNTADLVREAFNI
jgi:pyridoxal/pyridoxine/pyridoxamine kinase